MKKTTIITFNEMVLYDSNDYGSITQQIHALHRLSNDALESRNYRVHEIACREIDRLKTLATSEILEHSKMIQQTTERYLNLVIDARVKTDIAALDLVNNFEGYTKAVSDQRHATTNLLGWLELMY